MAGKFGPPALPVLTVSPIPGTFGQGFPGLIYLSTLAYLRPESPGRAKLNAHQEMFFNEILQAHETAHQWWGNVISAAGYRDYWLMEALANYSALLYLEKHKGARWLEQALDQYRADLLARGEGGVPVDETGPIVLGTRLESSLEPRAWRAITYGKGSWIMHMLRRIMGDERFLAMIADLRRRYEHLDVSTEQFREHTARFLPSGSEDPKLDLFFDRWVYSTGIPAIKMTHSVKGLKVTGTVTQAEAGEDFSVLVPVEIQFARGKSLVHWVRTSNEPVTFSVTVRQPPLRVLLDPHYSVLRRP
jgi:aminopeptidase N